MVDGGCDPLDGLSGLVDELLRVLVRAGVLDENLDQPLAVIIPLGLAGLHLPLGLVQADGHPPQRDPQANERPERSNGPLQPVRHLRLRRLGDDVGDVLGGDISEHGAPGGGQCGGCGFDVAGHGGGGSGFRERDVLLCGEGGDR